MFPRAGVTVRHHHAASTVCMQFKNEAAPGCHSGTTQSCAGLARHSMLLLSDLFCLFCSVPFLLALFLSTGFPVRHHHAAVHLSRLLCLGGISHQRVWRYTDQLRNRPGQRYTCTAGQPVYQCIGGTASCLEADGEATARVSVLFHCVAVCVAGW